MQDLLQSELYGNGLSRWAAAVGLALLVLAAMSVVSRIGLKRVRRLAKSTDNDVDDLFAHLLGKTKWVFIVLLALWTGSLWLTLPVSLGTSLRYVFVIGLFLQAGFWGTGIINFLLARYRKRQMESDPAAATAVGAMGFIARVGLWTVVLLVMLPNLDIDVTALLTGLGVGGIALALAVQNVLGDLLGSLSIVLDKPFTVGDYIVVGDEQGTVQHVGLKTTRVKALSGEQLIFSNSDLLTSRIRNYGRMSERRAVFTLGVEYGTPRAQLERIPTLIREAIERRPHTRFERCHFKRYGDSALEYETVFFMVDPSYATYMDAQEQINLELYEVFEREGIPFAFPTQTLILRNESASPEGTPGTGPEPERAPVS